MKRGRGDYCLDLPEDMEVGSFWGFYGKDGWVI
jgi:hypothetical protein